MIFGRLFRKNCLTGLTDAYELLVGIICNSLGQRERHSAIASTRRFELGKKPYITSGFEASVEMMRGVLCVFSCDEQCAALMLTQTEQLVSKTAACRFIKR